MENWISDEYIPVDQYNFRIQGMAVHLFDCGSRPFNSNTEGLNTEGLIS